MEQEQVQQQQKKKKPYKTGSAKKHLATILNPLKTGIGSKYFNSPRVVRLLKDPLMMGELLLETIDKIQNEDLDVKVRIVYLNVLANIYKAIFKVDLGSAIRERNEKENTADVMIKRLEYYKEYGEMFPVDVGDKIYNIIREWRETKAGNVLNKLEDIEKRDEMFKDGL